jgi:signal transduction histidine kinase
MDQNITPREVLAQAFPGIAGPQADEIITAGQVRTYPAEVTLCHEGVQESIFYIILSGHVRISKQSHNEQERTLQHLGPGGFFGEIAILHEAPRAASVTTVSPTIVLEIHKEAFTGIVERSSSVSLAIVRAVSRRLRENDEMAIEDLRIKAQELAEAYQQLAEEDIARSQFLTVAAHELRTPLMAANGYMQGIHMGMFQGEALDSALDVIWRNLQEVISLTNDILFLQEMELILPEFHPTDLVEVIKAAVEQEKAQAERGLVQIRLEAAPDLRRVPGDPKSLQRAFAAIIDNAIKFSPDGGEVRISVVPDQAEPANICITIQDQGVGIPSEAMPRIFQRFFHLDVICGRVFRGIGLGLSIAKHVVDQHQGTIEIQSQEGQGSIFIVRLHT